MAATALTRTESAGAAGEAIEVTRAWLEPTTEGDGWALSADVTVPIPARIEEALGRGVSLPFVLEFELTRARWYWRDEKITQASQMAKLAYHALTRQYRVTLGNTAPQHFAALDEALRAIGAVRGWRVVEPDQVKAGTVYDAQVRMRLDASQLPKPFQVTALTNRDWNLQAEWKRFNFSPETAKSAQ